MMNQKVTGDERLAAICQVLRQETLTPAQQEADTLVKAARTEADEIRDQAKKEAESLKRHALQDIEREKVQFQASLQHATNQAIASLKEQIENLLFKKGLDQLVSKEFQSTEQLSSVLIALANMIEKQGLAVSPEVWVGKAVNKEALLHDLTKHVLSKPLEEQIKVGSFTQGIKLVIKEKHISIEVTDESIRELLASILRRDFRKYLFHTETEET